MPITVVITTWYVPFSQTVRAIKTFDAEADAVAFINAESLAWWLSHDGERCRRELPETVPYETIAELGYDVAHYELWGGEAGFSAMLDHATYARLNEAHYAGKPLPGYLQVAKMQGNWPT